MLQFLDKKMLDFENLKAYLDYFDGSKVLSAEQRAMLQTSLVVTKHEMHFKRLLFWGRINGVEADYFIVQGVGENIVENSWFNRTTLFSQVKWGVNLCMGVILGGIVNGCLNMDLIYSDGLISNHW